MITKDSADTLMENNKLSIGDEITFVLDNGDTISGKLYRTSVYSAPPVEDYITKEI